MFLDAYRMARYCGMIVPPDVKDDRLLTIENAGFNLGKPYDGPPPPALGF